MRHLLQPLAFAAIVALTAPLAAPLWAQTAPGVITYRADNTRTTTNPTGLRGDGNVRIRGSEFDFDADALAYDGKGLKEFSEIRARGKVKLRLAPTPKSSSDPGFEIRSNSDEATLTRTTRTLILKGNLSGFYRVGNGPQTSLAGEQATFYFGGAGLNALIEGAAGKQVELLLPAETGKSDAIGPVKVRANKLRIDEANNAAYFTGNARALSSSDGGNRIDVAAPAFTLRRAADGTIGTLKTEGKTVTKINVAPDPAAPATANALSYVEVTADQATVDRATSTGVFEGNVTGFYLLQNSPQKYDISGKRVVVSYDAKAAKTGDGLSVNATGVDVEIPGFSLGF